MYVKDNQYIPNEDKDFFILLRIGLWQRVEEPLSPSPDWPYIYRLSCEQTVQGIVSDGIAIYRSQYPQTQIPQDINDQFLSATAQIVRRNYTINQKQAELNKFFEDNCIKAVVVKGQEAAKCYPKPMLRVSGDIDYLLPLDHFKYTNDILSKKADRMEDENDYLVHVGLFFGDIEVELHGSLHPNLGACIDKVIDKAQEDLFRTIQNHSEHSERDRVSYETFNTIYIFLHCLQHFHWSGLGLRQITDWCMLLSQSSSTIDWNYVKTSIEEMKLQTEWSTFLQFCTQWLGLETPLSFRRGARGEASLWTACKASGNMGHHADTLDISSSFLSRNINRLKADINKYIRTKTVSPHISRTMLLNSIRGYLKQTIE